MSTKLVFERLEQKKLREKSSSAKKYGYRVISTQNSCDVNLEINGKSPNARRLIKNKFLQTQKS